MPRGVRSAARCRPIPSRAASTWRPVEALLPVEIRVYAADGDEIDGAGYLAAEGGVATVRVTVRLDDPAGAFRVVCRDRASGREAVVSVE